MSGSSNAVDDGFVAEITPCRPGSMLFTPGRILATPGALALLERSVVSVPALMLKHCTGDRGTLCDEDVAANVYALASGARIFSAFDVDGEKLWIITDAAQDEHVYDRQTTTLLLPDEY